MHTLKIIAVGFVLLGIFLLAAPSLGAGRSASMATAAKFFIPVWFAGAAINLWFGVSHAGYSVRDEAPIFLLIFAVPTAVALLIWWHS